MLGVNASLLRFWEKEFNQIKPKTNARGKRSYNSNDIEVIRSVYVLVKEKGFTLDGARKALKARKGMAAEIANEARVAAQMTQTDARAKGTEKPVVQEKSRKEAVTILKRIRAELLTLRAEIKS